MLTNRKFLISVSAVSLILGFVLVGIMVKKDREKETASKANKEQSRLVRPESITLGPSDAKVTLVEFLDPECESCRAFNPYVKQFMEVYSGKIRLVVRYAPFHRNSRFVITMLEAIRKQGKYWEALNLFFVEQPVWGNHHNPNPDYLWKLLPKLDLDIEKVKKDMQDPEIQKLIAQDVEDGNFLGVRATPTFFVNGKPLTRFGYQPLRQLIESEL